MNSLHRPPFIPWVCSFAAKIEQLSVKKMLSDPLLLSKSLINAQKLFGYDAICVVFDRTLEAEACGCKVEWTGEEELPVLSSFPLKEEGSVEDLDVSRIETCGRIPVTLEAAKRITTLRGREVPVFGVVTGPLSLAISLKGDVLLTDLERDSEEAFEILETAQKVGLKLSRSYCELGVHGIVVIEDSLKKLDPELFSSEIAPLLQSIWNVVRYFNADSIIMVRDCGREHIDPLFRLEADGVVPGNYPEFEYIKEVATRHNRCFSGNLLCSDLMEHRCNDIIERFNVMRNNGFFISTEWEVPYDTPVKNVHEIAGKIKSISW